MRSTTWTTIIVLIGFASASAWSAEVAVPPGDGTLAAAVAAANNGDILVLDNGDYIGNVVINKSLTLRANSRSTQATVAGSFRIDGAGIDVTVQGLIFATAANVDRAGAVKLLENTFASGGIDVSGYDTNEGDGSLAIIGNHLTPNNNIVNVRSQNAYIAGNILDRGYITVYTSAWIVGNEITYSSNAIYSPSGGVGSLQIIANRVTTDASGAAINISSGAALALIAGNVVRFINNTGGNRYGILTSGNTFATIINNVIDGQNTSGFTNSRGISVSSGRVAGNIIYKFLATALQAGAGVTVENNLCFDNATDCGTANGNLADDPLFVDTVDYRLGAGSPAIDAGPPDLGLADLDRTRNDIGAHGGPWSIGQYDVQRDPDNLAPYVFPLFKADSSFVGSNLEIRALGVARLR